MRWRASSLAVDCLLASAMKAHSSFVTGPRCCCSSARPKTTPTPPRSCCPVGLRTSSPRRLWRQRVISATQMSDTPGADDSYKRFMWKRRARRAMKYVSMPIVSVPGQPREQVCCCLRCVGGEIDFCTFNVQHGAPVQTLTGAVFVEHFMALYVCNKQYLSSVTL